MKVSIGFTGFLEKFIKNGEINHEMKNIGKTVFTKLEKFIIEKLETKLRMEEVDQRLQSK